MSAAHTPGPWCLNPRGWVVQSTGDIVTRLECSNNKEADARLMAGRIGWKCRRVLCGNRTRSSKRLGGSLKGGRHEHRHAHARAVGC